MPRDDPFDDWIIPPPCILCSMLKWACWTIIWIVVLGYFWKALYYTHINNLTLGQTLSSVNYWYPDASFFFWAIASLVLVYGLIAAGFIFVRCLVRMQMTEDRMDPQYWNRIRNIEDQ